VARLQRQSLTERGLGFVSQWFSNPQNKQFIDDLIASVKESPQHVGEFFEGEVLEAIKQHWVRIALVTGGLLLAEEIIAILAATPEPTMLTKVIAVILQIAVIAILGYFAAVEAKGAYDEGRNWFTIARRANGDPAVITEASRSFVRMVWHIVMAILALAGVRARVRGFTVPESVAAGVGEAGVGGGAGAGEPSNVTPISSHPGYRPSFSPPTSGQPSAYYGGSAAPKIEPLETPVEASAPVPAPPPAAAAGTTLATTPGPGVQPVPAAAAGLAAATQAKKWPPFVLKLPIEKAPHLATYRSWLGVLQSDPNYVRGNPAQLDKWHQAHRQCGSHPIPRSVYERGHALGLTGKEGEERIRVPDWSRRSKSIFMQVDHIIERQLTPNSHRGIFDEMDNYELLDGRSNVNSRNRYVGNIRAGEQLDAFKEHGK
jgi:hypothetical protein